MTKKEFTVWVEGNIGAGKSTLLDYFASQAEVVKEPVEKWQNVNGHNLLQLLYEDPARYAYLFQSVVMLTAVQNHLTTSSQPVKIIERSLFSAQYCFAENFYQNGQLHDAEYETLNQWLTLFTTSCELPVDLIIYLRCEPEIALERIKNRARKEEETLSLSYLRELHMNHENWLVHQKFPVPAPVLMLDANQDLSTMNKMYHQYQSVILGQNFRPQECVNPVL
jgi:deoxyadenosine/deoxycytidine kinase